MERIDFSDCELSGITYGGAEEKIGIIFNGNRYMLKFRKTNQYGECFNDVAEYIGGRVFEMLGMKSQSTFLGTYNNRKVVACKDFVGNSFFVPFKDVGESSIEVSKGKFKYRYSDIEELILNNKKLIEKENVINAFWDTYIIDALLANSDRHGRNWGFLKTKSTYELAPIFDNGSSLFSSFSSIEEMKYVLEDKDEILERVYYYPNSVILEDDTTRVSNYYSIISSLKYKECNEALKRVFPKIDILKIEKLIDNTDLDETKKMFLKTIVLERYNRILKHPYEELLKYEK